MFVEDPASPSSSNPAFDPIVVAGMGCRFPQAPDVAAFWKLLLEGQDVIGPVPADRWDIASFYDPDFRSVGQIHQAEGGFVEGLAAFDPAFFHLSRREALHMDPQQRLLLECVVQAAENAGVPLASLRGSKTGVFIGISTHDYNDILQSPSERENISAYTNQGGSLAIAANRISYVFDFRGPSLAVDTACSSSLYALREALFSLREHDCDFAFVGGVNANLKPEMAIGFSMGNYLSPTSRCRAFSADADGYVRSEGAGILLLTRRSLAQRHALPILAEIVAVAANEDGKTEGMALPNPQAQKELLTAALLKAGFRGAQIDYVECHGTGTPAGDPIECSGVGTIYGLGRDPADPCLIGSVKTNLGHLEAGSGAAGLIKLVLSMQHGMIPASLHCEHLSQAIDFDGLGLRVVRQTMPWPDRGAPERIAGINSFGFGGANAHAILKSPVRPPAPAATEAAETAPILVALTAHNDEALAAQSAGLLDDLDRHDLQDLGFTTIKHRDHYRHRAMLVAQNIEELRARLQLLAELREGPGVIQGAPQPRELRIGFVFSGQGPQWHGMGRSLLASDGAFAATVWEIDGLFRPKLGWSVWDALHRDEHEARMEETEIAQPTVFALQVALARRLQSLGIKAIAVTGHSLGEIAAAVVSGAITLQEGVDVIYHRSRLHQTASGAGRMMAAGLSPARAEALAARSGGKVSVAAINSMDAVAFSGDNREIHLLAHELTEGGVFNRLLRGKVPFHSHQMDQFKEELLARLGHLRPRESVLDFYSSTYGRLLGGEHCGAQYWVNCVREPVRFMDSLVAMIEGGIDTFIEISPHPVLSPSIEANLKAQSVRGLVLPTLRREQDDVVTFYSLVARLFCEGVMVEPSAPGRFVPLPNYPFQREILWKETPEGRRVRLGHRPHPHRTSLPSVTEGGTVQTMVVDYNPMAHAYLKDHVVQSTLVVPGATHLDLALSCHPEIYDVSFDRAYFVPIAEDLPQPQGRLQISGNDRSVRLQSRVLSGPDASYSEWITHMRARYIPEGPRFAEKVIDIDLCAVDWQETVNPELLYGNLASAGLALGETFRNIRALWTGRIGDESVSIAQISATPRIAAQAGRHVLHGVLGDSCLQSLLFLAIEMHKGQFAVYVPTSLRAGKIFNPAPADLFCVTRLRESTTELVRGDFWVYQAEEGLRNAGIETIAAEIARSALPKVAEFHDFSASYLEGSRGDCPIEQLELIGRMLAKDRLDQTAGRQAEELFAPFDEIRLSLNEGKAGIYPRSIFETYVTEVQPLLNRIALDALKRSPQPDEALSPGRAAWWRRVTGAAAPADAASESMPALAELVQRYPDFALEFRLLGNCSMLWLDQAADNRFAADNLDVLRRFYREAFSNSSYNAWAALHLRALLAGMPAGRTLRVLEIGAGTGGLTQALLPELPREGCTYIYSDISSSFFAQAKDDFAAYPFLEYRALDLEKDLIEQGIAEGSVDIVVAANVLHTSADLDGSLRNIRKVLASQGCLLMLEVTNAPLWVDVVFGLADGWWNFSQDRSVPREHASLSPARWQSVLRAGGFADVVASRLPEWQDVLGNAEPTAEQTIVLARAEYREFALPLAAMGKIAVIAAEAPSVAEFIRGLERQGVDVRRFDPLTPAEQVLDHAEFSFVLHVLAPQLFESTGQWNAQAAMAYFHSHSQSLRHWAQALLSNDFARVRDLGMRIVVLGESPITQAIWGCGRVVLSELPRLDFAMIRLDGMEDASIRSFVRELCQGETERRDEGEVVLRRERRSVYRMMRLSDTAFSRERSAALAVENFRYIPSKTGLSEAGRFVSIPRRAPGPHELEIEIKATGLNFRDVLLTSRMMDKGMIYSGLLEDQVGMECSGVVVRSGVDSEGFAPGDRVFACARGAAAKYVTVATDHVARMPDNLSFVEGASLPVAMLTAWEALMERGRLKAGETVLVHAAAGGVGQAAVQVALSRGATILATAGTEEKREFLLRQGVSAVFNSRDLAFGDQILQWTGGRGVDLILNSLSGPAIEQNFRVLAPYGRFVEIGKADLYDEHRISLYPFRKNISYSAVDLDAALVDRPAVIGETLRTIAGLVAEGKLGILPVREFGLDRINEGMQLMARSAHIGKVVLSASALHALPVVTDFHGRLQARSDRAYVISGGSGGIGLVLAEWLANKGATKIALLSPSGDRKLEVRRLRRNLFERGVDLRAFACDVADAIAVSTCLDIVRREMAPIGGVFHGAMVLDDGQFVDLDEPSFDRTMRPKALGAMELHVATAADPLDLFVMFSSCSAAFGNPRQANYNAANLFLEGLSAQRQWEGRPACTVQLGVVGGVGFVARNRNVGQALGRIGWRLVHINEILAGLEKAICEQPVVRCLADADWQTVSDSFASDRVKKRLERLVLLSKTAATDGDAGACVFEKALARPGALEAFEIVATGIQRELSKILASGEALVRTSPITDFGLDSLMITQLRYWIQSELKTDIPLMQLMQGPSIDALTRQILEIAADRNSAGQTDQGQWILGGFQRPEARMRLFCFAYMGGASSQVFGSWADLISPDVELCPVALPGSMDRSSEEPIEDFHALIEHLADVLQPYCDKPFAIYGHSQGALIGFEWLRELSRRGCAAMARHLIVGAYPAPQRPRPFREITVLPDSIADAMPEALERQIDLFGLSDVFLADRNVRQALWPSLRAGFRLGDSYRFVADPKLHLPITVVAGLHDRAFAAGELADWNEQTSGSFEFLTSEGGHLFVNSHKIWLAKELNRILVASRVLDRAA